MSVTSAFAGVSTTPKNSMFTFGTFQTVDGQIFNDLDHNGIWTKINHWDGKPAATQIAGDMTLERILAHSDGRFVEEYTYYADSEWLVGSEVPPPPSDWDYFWGTTLDPVNSGWNDFWNQCADPDPANPGDCVGTVFAGIGFAIGIILVTTALTAYGVVIMTSAGPVTTTFVGPAGGMVIPQFCFTW